MIGEIWSWACALVWAIGLGALLFTDWTPSRLTIGLAFGTAITAFISDAVVLRLKRQKAQYLQLTGQEWAEDSVPPSH